MAKSWKKFQKACYQSFGWNGFVLLPRSERGGTGICGLLRSHTPARWDALARSKQSAFNISLRAESMDEPTVLNSAPNEIRVGSLAAGLDSGSVYSFIMGARLCAKAKMNQDRSNDVYEELPRGYHTDEYDRRTIHTPITTMTATTTTTTIIIRFENGFPLSLARSPGPSVDTFTEAESNLFAS